MSWIDNIKELWGQNTAQNIQNAHTQGAKNGASAFDEVVDEINEARFMQASKYGFKADENGFIEPAFNQKANIPSGIKIHTKTIDQINTHAKAINSNLDATGAMGKAWQNFAKFVNNDELLNAKSVSFNDLKNMPYSFSTDGSILGSITSVQSTKEQFDDMLAAAIVSEYSAGKLDIGVGGINFFAMAKDELNAKEANLLGDYLNESGVDNEINASANKLIGASFDENLPNGHTSISAMFALFVNDQSEFAPNGTKEQVSAFNDLMSKGGNLKQFMADEVGQNGVVGMLATFANGASLNQGIIDSFNSLLDSVNDASKAFYAKLA